MKSKKFLTGLLWFILGALCFIISQPLIRIPILTSVQKTTGFAMFSYLYPLLAGSIIGLTAGIAEESFRFLFKRFLIKPAKSTFSQPIIFGLGHGIIEAAIILIPPILAGYSLTDLSWGFIERSITIVLHVTLTIVVWNGFQRNKKLLYVILAILIHGLVDASIVFFAMYKFTIPTIELAFALITLVMVIYALHSRKYYISGGETIEKEN